MSLDPPTYLNSLQNNIRARPIPWEGAVRAGTITENELKKIKAVDKVRKEQRKQTVESDLASYRSLLVGGEDGKSVLESAAKRADVIQYILVLAGDLMNGEDSRCITRNSSWMAAYMMPSRHSIVTLCAPRIPRPLQAFPAITQPVHKPRRPYTTSHLLRPHQPPIQRLTYQYKVHA